MKITLLIVIAAAILLLLTIFLRTRPSNHLDVTPEAREKIEKAKRK